MKQMHQFELTLSRRDGTALLGETGEPAGPIPVQADFDPVREWATFQALCTGELDARHAVAGDPEPVWDDSRGAPHVRALSVRVTANGSALAFEFPTTCFSPAARALSSAFVQGGQLRNGELFHYAVTAHPCRPTERPDGGRSLCVRRKIPPLELRPDGRLNVFRANARPHGDPDDEDIPVFVAERVLDGIARQTEAAGALETGAFLLGHLHRCPVEKRVFLSITDQVPAEHTKEELVRLTFTAQSFDAARSAARARGRGELLAGWAHSHSWLQDTCKDCEKRTEGTCAARADFFSDEDVHVHRTAFLKAFTVALVASYSPCSGLIWALYGWRLGMIRRRGFYILPNPGNPEGETP